MQGIKAKQTTKSILLFILCIICAVTFCACSPQKQTVQNGIVITDNDAKYSNTTRAFALDSLNIFLQKVYSKAVTSSLTENILSTLNEHAKNVEEITAKQGLSENTYLTFYQKLKDNADSYANAFASVKNGSSEQNQTSAIRNIVTDLTSLIGVFATAKIAYETCVYYYGYKHQKLSLDYEKYKFPHLKADAEKALLDKQTLEQEITEKNFIPTVKLAFFCSELFFGKSSENSLLDSFTTQEILLLVKNPDFSSINITAKGWELIISLFAKIYPLSPIQSEIFNATTNNGDLSIISKNAQSAVQLICLIQQNFNAEKVQAFKDGNTKQVINLCFKDFNETEWELFKRVTDLNLKNTEYNELCLEYYGEKYTDYLQSTTSCSFESLKTSVDSDNFLTLLGGYIKSICPAIFYGE